MCWPTAMLLLLRNAGQPQHCDLTHSVSLSPAEPQPQPLPHNHSGYMAD